MATFYHVQVGALENARISDDARSVLADLLFGDDQGADARNVFCRFAAGWNGFCAEGGGTAVVNGAMRRHLV
jgi:hypothetical protein